MDDETSSGMATRLEEAMRVWKVVGTATGVVALTDGTGAAEVGMAAALVAMGAAEVWMGAVVASLLGTGAAEGATEEGAESLAPSMHCE